jgi:hypothetical protein
MRELVPAWPPGAVASSTSTSRPSDAAYTAGAHDDDVAHDVGVERRVEAELAREALDGRVLEDLAGRADDDRHLVDADLKPIEHLLHGGIRVDVLVRERLRVAREELAQLHRGRRVERAHEHERPAALRDEAHAP